MRPEDNWILFLERNPSFFKLSKDSFSLEVLEKVGLGSKSMVGLKKLFPETSVKKIRRSLKKLIEHKVIASVKLDSKDFYVITGDGKKLFSAYKKVSKFFKA